MLIIYTKGFYNITSFKGVITTKLGKFNRDVTTSILTLVNQIIEKPFLHLNGGEQ